MVRFFSYFAMGIVGFLVAWMVGVGNRNDTTYKKDTFCDFLRTQPYEWNTNFRSGLKPIERLPVLPNSEVWTVIYLLDRNSGRYATDQVSAEEYEKAYASVMGKMDRGKLAVMLENMPSVPDVSILWAITTLLEEKEPGYYSRKTLLIEADYKSDPIREIAHEILCRSLGVDHGYNISLWRKEIADHALKGYISSQ
jgi:hypothetical protein